MQIQRAILAVTIGMLLVAAALLLMPGQQAQAAPMASQTVLAVTNITRAGVTDTLTSAITDGQRFSNDGKTFLEVANGYTDTVTVTVETPGTVDGLAIADLTVAIPAGSTKLIGPFQPSLFNQLTGYTGFVYVSYSAVTTVTVAAWRLN